MLRLIIAVQLLIFIVMQAVNRNVFGLERLWLQSEIFLIVLLIVDIVWIIIVYRGNSREIEQMMREKVARNECLRAQGKEAVAEIKKIAMGSCTVTTGVSRELEVLLELEVTPENSAPFSLRISLMISELHIPQYQPGKQIRIRYVPDDPENCEVIEVVNN